MRFTPSTDCLRVWTWLKMMVRTGMSLKLYTCIMYALESRKAIGNSGGRIRRRWRWWGQEVMFSMRIDHQGACSSIFRHDPEQPPSSTLCPKLWFSPIRSEHTHTHTHQKTLVLTALRDAATRGRHNFAFILVYKEHLKEPQKVHLSLRKYMMYFTDQRVSKLSPYLFKY